MMHCIHCDTETLTPCIAIGTASKCELRRQYVEKLLGIRVCGVCDQATIPRGADWPFWRDGKPVHRNCMVFPLDPITRPNAQVNREPLNEYIDEHQAKRWRQLEVLAGSSEYIRIVFDSLIPAWCISVVHNGAMHVVQSVTLGEGINDLHTRILVK